MDYQFLLDRPAGRDRIGPRQRLLYANLRRAIERGRLGPNHRLPGSRELAEQLAIARNTVVYAYEQLCAEGYLISSKRGTSVAALQAPAARKTSRTARAARLSSRARHASPVRDGSHDLDAFTPGLPALDAFPLSEWRAVVRRASSKVELCDLAYGPAGGLAALRGAISDRLRAARGLRCTPDQVLLTDGTQSALDLCARALAEPRDTVWMESPGYVGAHAAFVAADLRIQPVAVDENGMRTDTLHGLPAPRLIYLTPSHQFPMGGVLSLQRRMELLVLAHKHRALILEDDYDSDFRYDGEPLAALQGLIEDAPVIYLGTFSKTLFPGLRLGYLVAPTNLADPIRRVMGSFLRHGHQVDQAALTQFMVSGRYTRHLSRMRKLYKERQRALREALAKHLPELEVHGVKSGLHLVALLPPNADDAAICAAARRRGLNPQPLSRYCGDVPKKQRGLVLGYGNTREASMDRSVRALAGCIKGQIAG